MTAQSYITHLRCVLAAIVILLLILLLSLYHSGPLKWNSVSQYVPRGGSSTQKTLRLLHGWENYGMKKSPVICNDQYVCELILAKDGNPEMADLAIFYPETMTEKPPKKAAGQLWLLLSGESQKSMSVKNIQNWDGYFNYSVTFSRQSNLTDIYSLSHRKLRKPLRRNFAAEKTAKRINSLASPSALWFVSNCMTSGAYKVTSARMEYASQLSQGINISSYTKSDECKGKFNVTAPGLLKSKPATGEPSLDDFPFYLAFENSLCKDYITEKLWKVLEGDSLAIPIVMGGLEMEDYEHVAPPNSYIHVRNFTSPRELAKHLKYVTENEEAFNYYHQWRNEYELFTHARPDTFCYYCILAHERPASVWHKMSEHFNRNHCVDVSEPRHYRRYYNLTCL